MSNPTTTAAAPNQKIKKEPKGDEQATGVVVWAIEVTNQEDTPVAVYDILTLVVRRDV